MNTQPTSPDPNGLPVAPTRGCPVSAAMFDRLIEAARKGGMSAVFTAFAQGETTTETKPYGVYERPARRRTLAAFLDKRVDLKALLDSACQERRDRLIEQLEIEVEKIALSEGDVTLDYNKQGGIARKRVDRKNKLHALLKLLSAHEPGVYAERRRLDVDVAGQVNVAHAHLNVPAGYVIDVAALDSLEPGDRAEMMRLLMLVEDARIHRRQPPALPPGEQA